MSWPAVAAYAIVGIIDLSILGTTAYAVFGLSFSGWWFALAILLCCGNTVETVRKGA